VNPASADAGIHACVAACIDAITSNYPAEVEYCAPSFSSTRTDAGILSACAALQSARKLIDRAHPRFKLPVVLHTPAPRR
jgi:hypothetical protein